MFIRLNNYQMCMKKFVLVLLVFAIANGTAQEIEAVDSIDVETGIIYSENSVEVADTIVADSLLSPPIPQIPLGECDSLMFRSLDDRYAIMWKDGKCGIYDIGKGENVTKIEFDELQIGRRIELEDGSYSTFFSACMNEQKGIIGVLEETNQFVAIWMPKEEE